MTEQNISSTEESQDDLRGAIEAALGDEAPAKTPDGHLPVAEAAPETAEQAQERVRDERGRFAHKAADAERQPTLPGVPDVQQAKAEQVTQQTDANREALRAPASWKPDAREAWAALPEPVRAEVQRREHEVARVLNESAGARQFAERMSQTLSPYMGFIQADGGDPFTAVNGLLQTAAQLRVGGPAQKAQLVASIVQQYGVDISMLDSALAGVAPQAGPDQQIMSQVEQMVAQRLAPVQSMLQSAEQHAAMQRQAIAQEAGTEIQRFAADPKNEFFGDVREYMADLMEVADRRGVPMTLQQAYDQACRLHPDVSPIMMRRSTASSAQGQTAAAQRAKAAAVSVRGAPVSGPVGDQATGSSLRSAIEAAIAGGGQ